MNALNLLFSVDSDTVQVDESESDREGYDPFEALYMKIIMLALEDLYKGKSLYRLSALHFFRSDNFATCLHHLGCDGSTVDFIFEKMESILSGVEDELVSKGRYPEGLLTHSYFKNALDEEDERLEQRRIKKKAKAPINIIKNNGKVTKIPLHKYRQGELLDNLQECG